MDLLTAVTTPRVHSQLLPDMIYAEDVTLFTGRKLTLAEPVVELLRSKGQHNVTLMNEPMAITQFIAVNPDTQMIEGVSDPRKGGRPAAVH